MSWRNCRVKNTKILIVEDDEVTAANLQMSLEKQGYLLVSIAEDVVSAKTKIIGGIPDIVLIDISLQESNDGIILANYIRQKQTIPFIFLTGHTDNNTLEGASKTEPHGYLIKPFNPLNLIPTIQMALYKHNQEKKKAENLHTLSEYNINLKKLIFGQEIIDKPLVFFGKDFYFNTNTCEAFHNGKQVKLVEKENLFIKILIAHLGLVVSFKKIVAYIWGENGATYNNVRMLVYRLRNKLQTDSIKNLSGTGYYIEQYAFTAN